ncbi:hypothetical protein predicted by Glimmer/Critica [Stenotrophomonas maltophilia RA8]|nr:hypothetical protein predicted by Glimmer/Critica [Stenotrophomonas maltophilia RA8]
MNELSGFRGFKCPDQFSLQSIEGVIGNHQARQLKRPAIQSFCERRRLGWISTHPRQSSISVDTKNGELVGRIPYLASPLEDTFGRGASARLEGPGSPFKAGLQVIHFLFQFAEFSLEEILESSRRRLECSRLCADDLPNLPRTDCGLSDARDPPDDSSCVLESDLIRKLKIIHLSSVVRLPREAPNKP